MSTRTGLSRHRARRHPSTIRSPYVAGQDVVGTRDQFPTAVVFGLGLTVLVLLSSR